MTTLSAAAQRIVAQGQELRDEILFDKPVDSTPKSDSVHVYHHHRYTSPWYWGSQRVDHHHYHHGSSNSSTGSTRATSEKKEDTDHTVPLIIMTLVAGAITAGIGYYLNSTKQSAEANADSREDLADLKGRLSCAEKQDPKLQNIIKLQERILSRRSDALESKIGYQRGQLVSGAVAIGGGLGGLLAGPAMPVVVSAAYGLGLLGGAGLLYSTIGQMTDDTNNPYAEKKDAQQLKWALEQIKV